MPQPNGIPLRNLCLQVCEGRPPVARPFRPRNFTQYVITWYPLTCNGSGSRSLLCGKHFQRSFCFLSTPGQCFSIYSVQEHSLQDHTDMVSDTYTHTHTLFCSQVLVFNPAVTKSDPLAQILQTQRKQGNTSVNLQQQLCEHQRPGRQNSR